jgi:flavorubredoxin
MWWKVVLIVLGVLAIGTGVFYILMRGWDKEKPSKTETLQPESGEPLGKALIVYHPGAIGYTEEIAYAIGEGLQLMNWEVTLDRANKATVAGLTTYDVLLVGSPTYASTPRPPIMAYIDRCIELEGKKIVVFATGGHTPEESNKKMKAKLEQRGAKFVDSFGASLKQKGAEANNLAKEFGKKLANALKK